MNNTYDQLIVKKLEDRFPDKKFEFVEIEQGYRSIKADGELLTFKWAQMNEEVDLSFLSLKDVQEELANAVVTEVAKCLGENVRRGI